MHLTTWLYRCIKCAATFIPNQPYYTCPTCGGLLMVERDLKKLRSRFGSLAQFKKLARASRATRAYPFGSGVWRWRDLLLPDFPIEHVLSLHEGHTDLWEPPDWFKEAIGLKHLFVKCEGQSPSGSFKDRGMPIAISEALRLQATYPKLGIRFIVCASTGDTSAAAAMYTAYVRDRLDCIVLVPNKKISFAQLYQSLDAGATVLSLRAEQGFDDCMTIVQELCRQHPEMVLVNSKNPLRIVGQETISLEIFSDLNFKVPDWLVIPCGNGGNLAAQLNAWLLLRDLTIIDHLPGIIVAQTETANTLVRWIQGTFHQYQPGVPGPTAASAMNIQDPVSFPRIERLRHDFNLAGFSVTELELARTRAAFNYASANLCPQGAVAAAAIIEATKQGMIQPRDLVVMLSTASTLKFTDSGMQFHRRGKTNDGANRPLVLDATIDAVESALAKLPQ